MDKLIDGDFFSSLLRGLCTHEHMERKLTAILSADVHGYSRLMGEDEEATLRTLTAYREVMTALIQQYRGRVVDSPGDNLLAEFVSVVDAVRCAIEIQWELKARNAEMPAHRKMEFRIGINLGDVIVEGEKIYGEGINIAARLESLADPGGICISGTVYDHIENKLALGYEYQGEQAVKNITKPVRVYRVQTEPEVAAPTVREERGEHPRPRAFGVAWLPRPSSVRRPVLIGGVAIGVLVPGLLFFLWGALIPSQAGRKEVRSESLHPPGADLQKNLSPPVGRGGIQSPTPEPQPSSLAQEKRQPNAVGVMHFKALSADPQLEWMREAIRDNFNSQLSTTSGLKVYSKEYIDFLVQKGPSTEIEVANQLGIAKMISGSFQATANTLRIEAHIVDVQSGFLEVSDHVEGEQGNFFDLQRQLALKIMARLNVAVASGEKSVVATAPPAPSLDTYKLLLEAEGEAQTTGPLQKEGAHPQGSSRGEDDEFARVPQRRGWLEASMAWAQDTSPHGGASEEEAIRQILERYRQAYEKKDLTLLNNVYDTMTTTQREAHAKYFHNAQGLQVTIRDVDIAVRGNEAVVSYTREDQFIDVKTEQTVTLNVRLTKILVRTDGTWKIASRKK